LVIGFIQKSDKSSAQASWWEIGNEIYGTGEYGLKWDTDLHSALDPTTHSTNVAAFAKAMKASTDLRRPLRKSAMRRWRIPAASPPSRSRLASLRRPSCDGVSGGTVNDDSEFAE
jgi:hypothetical protein